MNKKFTVKILIDITMTILLLFLMARQITGDAAHEWIGAGMFTLWITHNVMNAKWYSRLFKGKHTPYRIVQTVTNSLLLLSMVGTMVSGIILSRDVFAFLPIPGGTAIARPLHILSVYWCFVLTAVHLGLHWNMIIGMIRKGAGSAISKTALAFLRIAAVGISVYGLYALIKNQLLSYMFMKSSFVFFDFEKPVLLFFIEYIAIMGLFVFLAHYIAKGVQRFMRANTSAILLAFAIMLSGCSGNNTDDNVVEQNISADVIGIEPATDNTKSIGINKQNMSKPYTKNTKISEVINDSAFGDYGRLIFPADTGYYSGDTLDELSLTWYSNIVPEKTVEIANYMKNHAEAGETIFYDIYTDKEKAADPAKKDTGLFFFKGNPGEKFAVCNAGGGFAFVGAMHDSFPHALELSKKGYNAFALIYRPGSQTACEDLARAISFIFKHAEELGVSTEDYSLWGGSAGARMVAYLGSYGSAAYGGDNLPRPGAVYRSLRLHKKRPAHFCGNW